MPVMARLPLPWMAPAKVSPSFVRVRVWEFSFTWAVVDVPARLLIDSSSPRSRTPEPLTFALLDEAMVSPVPSSSTRVAMPVTVVCPV